MLPMPIRRICAFLIDYCLIAIYIGALVFTTITIVGTEAEIPSTITDKMRGHAIAFITLTLPVWLYFTLSEASSTGATFGKRLLRLQVKRRNREQVSFAAASIRNGGKFLPWEVSHAAIWYVPGRPFLDIMPPLNLGISFIATLAAISFFLSLFIGNGDTPYDRLSGTYVSAGNKL